MVACVREAFQPEPRWSAALERGFRWWPSHASQSVWSEPAIDRGGFRVFRVHAETALVRGVHGAAAQLERLAAWNFRRPSLSAVRWNAEDGRVTLHCSAYVHAGELERSRALFAHAALLQLGEAERSRESLAVELNADADASAPADDTPRLEPDPLVSADAAYAARGREPSPFDREALDALLAIEPRPWLRARLERLTFHAELPCPASATAPAAAPGSAPGAEVALWRLSAEQPHPWFGAGALAVLQLPPENRPAAGQAAATAALLNEAEAREWTGCDTFGAWCVHPAEGLAFATFYPALTARVDLLESVAWNAALRARWARGFLARLAELRGQAS